MPDLDTALGELRALADRPPASPPSLDDVRAVARRHRQRRWVAGSAALVLLALVAAGWNLLGPNDEGAIAVVDTPTSTTAATTTTFSIPPGVVIEPSTGLDDGDVVVVTGSFSPSSVQGVGLCAEEGRDGDDRLRWCDIGVHREVVDGELHVTVPRRIATSEGVFDCAERPGRCVLGVRDNNGVDRSAPISFREGLGPLPPPGVSLARSELADGELVRVVGSGWLPDSVVEIRQCAGHAEGGLCDLARPLHVVADGDGRFRIDYLAYAWLRTSQGWQPCVPCSITATSGWDMSSGESVVVSADGEPILPALVLSPPGPYTPGQVVSVTGSGLQREGLDGEGWPSLAWCVAPADDVESMYVFGDHGPCRFMGEPVDVGNDGTFRVEPFELPGPSIDRPDVVELCAEGSGFVCGVALYGSTFTTPAVAAFELVP